MAVAEVDEVALEVAAGAVGGDTESSVLCLAGGVADEVGGKGLPLRKSGIYQSYVKELQICHTMPLKLA